MRRLRTHLWWTKAGVRPCREGVIAAIVEAGLGAKRSSEWLAWIPTHTGGAHCSSCPRRRHRGRGVHAGLSAFGLEPVG